MAGKNTKAKVEKKPKAKVEKKPKATKGEVEELVVTEAYLAEHPELEAEGVSVGDTIEVPKVPTITSPALKLGGEVAILKNGQYIRTFPKGSEEIVSSFLSKDPNYVAVEDSSILSITVSWREQNAKDGVMIPKSTTFTEANGEGWKQSARRLANEAPSRNCIVKLG